MEHTPLHEFEHGLPIARAYSNRGTEMLDYVLSRVFVFRDGEEMLPVICSNREFTAQFPQGVLKVPMTGLEVDFDKLIDQGIDPEVSVGTLSYAGYAWGEPGVDDYSGDTYHEFITTIDNLEGSLLGFCRNLTGEYDDEKKFSMDYTGVNPEEFVCEGDSLRWRPYKRIEQRRLRVRS